MRLERTLENISDGKLYDIEDKVKADAGGCNGCSACCHDVEDLVTLTPFDSYELVHFLNLDFDQLLENQLTLCEHNQILLPHLRMQGSLKKCGFLDADNRCSVHAHRPSICRLFPLGRVYENRDFKYFLQVDNCLKSNLKSVTVKKWIGIQHYAENKAFLLAWHELIKALSFKLKFVRDEQELQKIREYVLNTFYRRKLREDEDFYIEFWKTLPQAKQYLGIL